MELLSPAGNLLSAYSAFKGGADAIYIGGKQFSARASAINFSNEEIKEITFYAHSIGKKVYVTLNTLLFQDEFFQAVEFAKFLYSIAIDGVIIQDLGLAHYLHIVLPDLALNASTQLNCHNIEQAKALIKVGFKRIVLAREVNLELAKKIKALGVEIEVFGHGALCVSYSGNCLMSSFIGDRSGNRGRCAQPCRMSYSLLEDDEIISSNAFAISTKDLMTIDYLQEIIDAGIDSLKIEGRLKSNEYIYTVSKAYREAIDCLDKERNNNDSNKYNLKKIFTRQFTKGYLLNESPFEVINSKSSSHQGEVIGKVIRTNKERVSIQLSKTVHRLDGIRFNGKEQFGLTIEKMFLNKEPVEIAHKGDIIEIVSIEHAERVRDLEVIRTKDYSLLKEIEEELKKQIKVNISGKFIAKLNEPVSLTVSFLNEEITVKGDYPLLAEGNGTTTNRIKEQLQKSGDYPYVINDLELTVEKCFIPISKINELRNKAFESLKTKLIKTQEVNEKEYINEDFALKTTAKTSFIVENKEQEEAINVLNLNAYSSFGKYYKNENRVTNEVTFSTPHELVHFLISKNNKSYLVASPYCSITNSYALDCFYSFGFDECILSLENDYLSAKALIMDFFNRHNYYPNVGFIVYGKIDMMIMRSCPIGTHYNNHTIHCERCHKKKYELEDRIGEKYHLIGDSDCNIRILNSRPIFLFDRIKEIKEMGINSLWLILSDEDKEKVTDILDNLDNQDGEFKRNKYTRGHYNNRPL